MLSGTRDLSKAMIEYDPTDYWRDSAWHVWIPPVGPESYEPEGDTENGALVGPYGDSFWRTWQDACTFVRHALLDSCRFCDLPIEYVGGEWLDACGAGCPGRGPWATVLPHEPEPSS